MVVQKVALIGECMIEMQRHPSGEIRQAFGGDVLNTAVYLARLTGSLGVEVEFVTALGCDNFSTEMLDQWASEGVGSHLVQRFPDALPGLYLIENDSNGERRFLYWRSTSAARRCFDAEESEALLDALADFQLLYLSGISLAILSETGRDRLLRLLPVLRSRGVKVAFDNNYRPTLWPDSSSAARAYGAVLEQTDIALLTWEDEQALFGYASEEALFQAYARYPLQEIVVKRGALPCLIQAGGQRFEVAAEPVSAVLDTTAAGDSFSAAYLACRLQGGTPQLAARRGHRLAAKVIQHRGAVIDKAAMPTMPTEA